LEYVPLLKSQEKLIVTNLMEANHIVSSEKFTAEIVKTESLTTITKFEAEPATVMNVGAAAGSVPLSNGVINDQLPDLEEIPAEVIQELASTYIAELFLKISRIAEETLNTLNVLISIPTTLAVFELINEPDISNLKLSTK